MVASPIPEPPIARNVVCSILASTSTRSCRGGPLRRRIEALLGQDDQSLKEISRRVRILPQASRRTEPSAFQSVAQALLARHRIAFDYHGRGRNAVSRRSVSPPRLVHYRDNWYLDAWDHDKRALRTFALERIQQARTLDRRSKDITEERLNRHFASSYGIFAVKPKHRALLRFAPERARWVADERWHPEQKGRYDGNHYLLEIPYSDDRELVLDIMKHGPDVEVLSPKSLRKWVLEQHLRAVEQYQKGSAPVSAGETA
jgi:proteasome accessory factor C